MKNQPGRLTQHALERWYDRGFDVRYHSWDVVVKFLSNRLNLYPHLAKDIFLAIFSREHDQAYLERIICERSSKERAEAAAERLFLLNEDKLFDRLPPYRIGEAGAPSVFRKLPEAWAEYLRQGRRIARLAKMPWQPDFFEAEGEKICRRGRGSELLGDPIASPGFTKNGEYLTTYGRIDRRERTTRRADEGEVVEKEQEKDEGYGTFRTGQDESEDGQKPRYGSANRSRVHGTRSGNAAFGSDQHVVDKGGMRLGSKSKGYARKPDPDDPNDTGEDTVGAISAQNPAKYAEVMQSLTRNQREVFALYFGDGIIVNERLTMAEVARRIGAKANASTISQTIQRIKNKFRNAGLPMPLRTTNWKPN